MADINIAHKVNSSIDQFPTTLQEVFQRRPKSKSKRPKSYIDDTRTEISYSDITFLTNGDFETNDSRLDTPSSRSMKSKRSKKRAKGSKKSLKETSGCVHSADAPCPARAPPKAPVLSHLVTLNCPLCDEPECILNKASHCPLLRHNDPEPLNCTFGGPKYHCEPKSKQYLPVSGLVPRDDNGVAVTLLKENGGPIENSYNWANRPRWDVPSSVHWEHKISEWTTSPIPEGTKSDNGQMKKSQKFKNKRKGKATQSTLIVNPEITSNGEEPRLEEDTETRVILEGRGFKILAKGKEKILVNFDRKNCKYLGCLCMPPVTDCGCGEGAGGGKTATKHKKSCRSKPKSVSVLKDTSKGLEPIHKEVTINQEQSKTSDMVTDKSKASLGNGRQKKEQKESSNSKDDNRISRLSAKDIRNQSRAEILERSLRVLLGDDCPAFCQRGLEYMAN